MLFGICLCCMVKVYVLRNMFMWPTESLSSQEHVYAAWRMFMLPDECLCCLEYVYVA
jgi:hypothetical protein